MMSLEEIFMLVLGAALILPLLAIMAAFCYEVFAPAGGRKQRRRKLSPLKFSIIRLIKGRSGKRRKVNHSFMF